MKIEIRDFMFPAWKIQDTGRQIFGFGIGLDYYPDFTYFNYKFKLHILLFVASFTICYKWKRNEDESN